MKPSPVQLLQLFFQKLSVELDTRHLSDEVPNPLTTPYNFDGVTMRTSVGISEPDHPTADESVYQLSFGLIIDNEAKESLPNQRFSPYLLDIQVVAWVRLHRKAENLGPLRDLALVNGAALIWSAIREQVAITTARMPYGTVQLPTVHFQDLRSEVAPRTKPTTTGKRAAVAKG